MTVTMFMELPKTNVLVEVQMDVIGLMSVTITRVSSISGVSIIRQCWTRRDEGQFV